MGTVYVDTVAGDNLAGARPFLLLVDGKVTPCEEAARAVFPHDGDDPKHNIEVHLTKQGVQVNIVDEHNALIEAVHVHRGDGEIYDDMDGAPETNEEALEEVHAALVACTEFGVPLHETFTYLLSRAAEIAYSSAMPRSKFIDTCVKVYEQVLTKQSEDKEPIGEA